MWTPSPERIFCFGFANSLILSLGAVALTMIVGLFAGYAFAKMKFRGRDALFSLIIPLMSVPPVAMPENREENKNSTGKPTPTAASAASLT